MELVNFLRARLDADERVARAASAESWADEYGEFRSRGGDNFAHVLRHDPARVLAEVEAKRRIVDLCDTETPETGGLPLAIRTLRLLALPYADHPDYDEAWRPQSTNVL